MDDRDSALRFPDRAREPAGPDRHERLRRDLDRAVAAVCPSWLASERDDLVQAAMLKVMAVERRGEAPGEGVPPLGPSYLYRVAHSAVIDEIRARRRRPEVPLEEDEVASGQTAREPAPDASVHGHEIGGAIRACLAAMKRERRLAIVLRLLGHSVPDAARLLGWSGKSTENLVYRGLADLRACLESKGFAP
jgi:RNA polymerase sigma-70 factor (ECF subfamily)